MAVPSPFSVKDKSGGREPDSAIATGGDAKEVVTVNVPDWFSWKVANAGDVNSRTEKVASWVTAKPIPLAAPNVTG